MSWTGNFLKNNKQGEGMPIKKLRVFKYENDHYGVLKSNFPVFKTRDWINTYS